MAQPHAQHGQRRPSTVRRRGSLASGRRWEGVRRVRGRRGPAHFRCGGGRGRAGGHHGGAGQHRARQGDSSQQSSHPNRTLTHVCRRQPRSVAELAERPSVKLSREHACKVVAGVGSVHGIYGMWMWRHGRAPLLGCPLPVPSHAVGRDGGGLVVVHPPRRVRTCLRQSELRRARSPSSVVSKVRCTSPGASTTPTKSEARSATALRRTVQLRAARPASRRTSTAAPYAPTSTNSGSSSSRASERDMRTRGPSAAARPRSLRVPHPSPGSSRRSSRRWPRPSQPSSRERLGSRPSAPDPMPERARSGRIEPVVTADRWCLRIAGLHIHSRVKPIFLHNHLRS